MSHSKLKLQKSGSALAVNRPPPSSQDDDALLAFAEETHPEAQADVAAVRAGRTRHHLWYGLALLAVVAVIVASTAYLRSVQATTAAPSQAVVVPTGTVLLNSQPDGAEIVIDDIARGQTPARVELPGGIHSLELVLDGTRRTISLAVDPGTTVSHHIELPVAPTAPVMTGRLEIASDPAGAQVTVDGTPRGRTPLTVGTLSPGEHTVTIGNGGNALTRKVAIKPGSTGSIFANITPPGSAAGWVVFKTPIDLQIFEANRLIGTTAVERLMLPAGRHDLELVNVALQFQRAISVQVPEGATVTPTIELPNGRISINALPWAEVSIDGKPVGTTPLGNVAVPIGSHEVLWRHPQLGERRQTIAVPAVSPVRLGVDFNQ